jgi:hypothetical protein
MLIVFGVVPAQKSNRSLAHVTVQIFHLVVGGIFPHYYDTFFYQLFCKTRRLPKKSFNDVYVVLSQHCGHRIVLGRKIEKREIISFTPARLDVIARVNIGKLVHKGIRDEPESGKCKATAVIKSFLIARRNAVVIELGGRYVHTSSRKGNVNRVTCRAHGE